MLGGVALADNRMSLVCKVTAIIKSAFDEGLMPFALSINVLPSLGAVERQLIWGNSYDGALNSTLGSITWDIEVSDMSAYHICHGVSGYRMVGDHEGS